MTEHAAGEQIRGEDEAIASDVQAQDSSETIKPSPSFWQRLMNLLPSAEKQRRQLEELNTAIALHPDVAANYVLRGELHLKNNAPEQALEDFQQALELASYQLDRDNWGFLDQVMQDRALYGIKQAQRKIG